MRDERVGIGYGVAAYVLWGAFPLYFVLFARSGPVEIVAHRALWSLGFCVLLLAGTRGWASLREALANRKVVGALAVAGVLIAVNWTTYVYGISVGRTLDAALGYFINPLAVALLGILVLGEQLSRLQWVAMGLGAAAVAVLVVGYGDVPVIALTLAVSFGLYSLVKKMAGASVAPVPGLAIETAAIAPVALGYLGWLSVTGQATMGPPTAYWLLLASTGVVTAVPLLLFAAAARRVSMVTIAILQYLAPIGQFLLGWLVFDEPMPPARWAGFALVWGAVAAFVVDAVIRQPRPSGTGGFARRA